MTSSNRSLPIRIEGLSKRYGNLTALDDVHLDIAAGEFLTMLGPSGSGKTTLLMAMAGFVRPDSGHIRFGGADVVMTPPHKRNVGMVFQNYALFPHMTVLDNVAYPLRVRGMSRRSARERAEGALDMVQLAGVGERRTNQLSGGQQQRVALARAIVFEPPVLLMDEPLSALDKKLREAMQIEIRRIHERVGATTVYVTHDQREAFALSDRVAVLGGGKLLQVDTPESIYHNPRNLFIADFLGDSHFLPLETRNGEICLAGGVPLRLSAPPPDPDTGLVLLVRPEKLELLDGHDNDDGYNRIEGHVERRMFLGDSVLLTVTLPGAVEVSVKVLSRNLQTRKAPGPGEKVVLGLHALDTFLLPAQSASGATSAGSGLS